MSLQIKRYLAILSRLSKFRISIAVALTTFTGYLLSHGEFTRGIVFPVVGVFFLACASSALNQVQEHRIDRIMPRTRKRPIPLGEITVKETLMWVILWGLAGTIILWQFSGIEAAMLGLLTFVWYNGIYTPLKKRTAFAAVPGGVVGALPPIIGWVAAGGSLLDPTAIALGFFFFIGQTPHFWILLLRFGREYEMAGLKTLTTKLSDMQIRRLTFVWIVATAVSAFMLPAFYPFENRFVVYLIWLLSVGLVISFVGLLRPSKESLSFSSSFMRINIYYFLVMVLLCFEALT